MQILDTQKPLLVALTMAVSVARVAVFSNEQGRLDDYRDFVDVAA